MYKNGVSFQCLVKLRCVSLGMCVSVAIHYFLMYKKGSLLIYLGQQKRWDRSNVLDVSTIILIKLTDTPPEAEGVDNTTTQMPNDRKQLASF